MRFGLVLGVALLLALAGNTEERTRARLRFDPFAVPQLERPSDAEAAPAARERGWAPILRATLVAGDDSLANLGGTLLALGEESHGYRLVEVRAWEAVFEYGGERKVLPVTSSEEGSQ